MKISLFTTTSMIIMSATSICAQREEIKWDNCMYKGDTYKQEDPKYWDCADKDCRSYSSPDECTPNYCKLNKNDKCRSEQQKAKLELPSGMEAYERSLQTGDKKSSKCVKKSKTFTPKDGDKYWRCAKKVCRTFKKKKDCLSKSFCKRSGTKCKPKKKVSSGPRPSPTKRPAPAPTKKNPSSGSNKCGDFKNVHDCFAEGKGRDYDCTWRSDKCVPYTCTTTEAFCNDFVTEGSCNSPVAGILNCCVWRNGECVKGGNR